MTRRVLLWSMMGLFASGALLRAADEPLRIIPNVSKDDVVVSFEGPDVDIDGVRAAIASGLRTTFTYEVDSDARLPGPIGRSRPRSSVPAISTTT